MTVRVLTGSKQQIAEQVARLPGEVREAIVFIDEAADAPSAQGAGPAPRSLLGPVGSVEEFFAEMQPYMADAGDAVVDDSRDAIYERQEGE